ncbi:MAG: ATP-binding protein [bacterium]
MRRPRPHLRSLFVRIFLFFWLAMTLIGAAFAVIHLSSRPAWVHKRKLEFITVALRTHGVEAVSRLRQQGPGAAHDWNRALEKRLDVRVHLLHRGASRAGPRRPNQSVVALAAQALREGKTVLRVFSTHECYAVPLSGQGLDGWVVVGELPHRPRLMRYLQPETLPLRMLVVFLVSGLICYLLARYISKPIRRLQLATRKLAQGNLDARVGGAILRRRDETGELGREFDQMADRIQALLDAQGRLLRDISHELRSPLARLSVALGLARQKAGAEAGASLDRIEKEAERLNELIGHLTTLTRLESGADVVEREPIDLKALVEEVGQDTSFEGIPRDRGVEVDVSTPLTVHGNQELLRRALENIVRNGLHYTAASTQVEVRLEGIESDGRRWARITVRDHGPGVPEAVLGDIFRPFFRVADDRGRRSGGSGIGLAISHRAVLLHGGSLSAENAEGGGLRVVVELPLAGPTHAENVHDGVEST